MTNDSIAPDFTLTDQYGNNFHLYSELKEHNRVLLVFYPKDDSPVCTKQLCEYDDNLKLLNKKGIHIAGINSDSVKQHQKFAERYNLKFPLLADTEKSVCRLYDALSLIGTVKRKIVLVDNTRKILFSDAKLPFKYYRIDEILGHNL